MEAKKEFKTGTIEELNEDLKTCGFKEEPIAPVQINLEGAMAIARTKLDTAVRNILSESGLSLSLFDYVATSVLADIRKADIDTLRINNLSTKSAQGEKHGDTKQAR